MNDNGRLDLYELLPALYRIRDAERGYPLRALLGLVSEQASVVKQNIDGLWDDLFIETCADWVIPYIGDLIGNTPLHEGVPRRRADVAKTIYYRRRKGTLPMLEELARDVTGWGSHAVAFFEQLGWTQNLNHLRYQWSPDLLRLAPDSFDRVGTVNVRNLNTMDRLDGPFDLVTHTVDVRAIRQSEGWYNIRNIGFFLWRLFSYRLTEVTPRQASVPYGYHFSTLGCPMPLFTHVERETDEAGLAREIHVPGPLRPLALHVDLEAARGTAGPASESSFVGQTRSVFIKIIKTDGMEDVIPPEEIVSMDLEEWKQPPDLLTDSAGTSWPVRVGIDARRGRFVFMQNQEPQPGEGVVVSYNYGFSADLGGGPYDRRSTMTPRGADTWHAVVSKEKPDPEPPEWHASILDALSAWSAAGPPAEAVIEILDNGTYEEELSIDLSGAWALTLQAADDKRPTLRLLNPTEPGLLTIESSSPTKALLTLNGLLLEGGIVVRNNANQNSLGALRLLHCTLVPGHHLDEVTCDSIYPDHPSLEVEEPSEEIEVTIDHSITGWLLLPPENVALTVRDSILDAMPRQQTAYIAPAILSGNLAPFSPPTVPDPSVQVTIGNEGPFVITIPAPHTTLTEVRDGLQSAIRAASASPAFQEANVLLDKDHNRLIIVPGEAAPITIDPAPLGDGDDPTATELRLVRAPGEGILTWSLIGGPLPSNITLSAASPRLVAFAGTGPPVEIAFDSNSLPATSVQARDQLQQMLHNVDLGDTALNAPYVSARVVLRQVGTESRLVVVPGTDDAIVFRAPPDDATTLVELGLQSPRPALAASFGGEHAGPPVILERVTIFGPVRIRTCTLASEVLFTEPVVAERRQEGCVRFSYVAPGSRTPRRYRSQPDLALETRAEEKGLPSSAALSATDRDRVISRIRPRFTSVHYGDPGYAQLSLTTAREIRTGAEDGAEMGSFCLLKQPQREANLRIRLEEYLPFGLEPGLILVT